MENYNNLCGSVANKVAMVYGEVNFSNVVKLLESKEYPTTTPPDLTIERFAAMVVQVSRNG